MSTIRHRRTSLRTALGITKQEKGIKRELGITAILKPFRWWGDEEGKIQREVGYYSPAAKLARPVLPRSLGKLLLLVFSVLKILFVIGWVLNSVMTPATKYNMTTTHQIAGRK